jgi:hypothetical protein
MLSFSVTPIVAGVLHLLSVFDLCSQKSTVVRHIETTIIIRV